MTFALVGAFALLSAACGSSSKSTGATSATSGAATSPTTGGTGQAPTGSPIKIGFIYSATGGASSSYVDSEIRRAKRESTPRTPQGE